MKSGIFKACVAVMIALGIACSSDSPTQPDNPPSYQPPDLSKTPRENSEAEIAAMVLSHEIVAPQWLYERIASDFDSIRARFGDSLPVRSVHFNPIWMPSSLGAKIIASELDDSATGGRKMFDSLNQAYRMTAVDTFTFDSGWINLSFEGILNSVCLVDIYSKVRGIKVLYPNIHIGDNPEIYIYPVGDTFLYFFCDAWGDCPAGCIQSKFYYFRTWRDRPRHRVDYIGSYQPDWDHPELAPSWFDTALLARDTIRYLKGWRADSATAAP